MPAAGGDNPVATGGSDDPAVAAAMAPTLTATEVCQVAADSLGHPGRVAVAVLLRVSGALHCYGVAGTWRVYYAIPPEPGAIGAALASRRPAVDDPVYPDDSPYPVTPMARVVLCVPIPGNRREPLGVIKLELPDRSALEDLRVRAVEVAQELGERLARIGYVAQETPTERLVRHTLHLVTGQDRNSMVREICQAACEVSGLSTAVGIRKSPGAPPVLVDPADPRTPLSLRLDALTAAELSEIVRMTGRHGTWYTAGSPEEAAAPAPRSLLRAGARTVISIWAGFGLPGTPYPVKRIVLVLDERARHPTPETVGLLQLLSTQAHVSYERLQLIETLAEQAKRDPLTGLGHQEPLAERLADSQAERTAVLVMDVDNFKQVNDTRGHAAGDRVLMKLARSLDEALRPQDELFRTGGDEFVALLDTGSVDQAERIGRRMLRAARRAGCTISVGVAGWAAGETAEHVLRHADQAMYRAKRDGRNRLRRAEP